MADQLIARLTPRDALRRASNLPGERGRVARSLLHRALRSLNPRTSSWEELVDRIRRPHGSIVGIDLFDTVVARRLVTDAAMEHLVARRAVRDGLWTGSTESYLSARRAAHRDDPMASLRTWLAGERFDELRSVDAAHQLEVELEQTLTVPIPGVQAALAELRRDHHVSFVSDMHLGADALRSVLDRHGIAHSDDRVVVSCESNASKSRGDLFDVAFPEASESDRAIPFVGNDQWSDVTQAAAAGLRPVPHLGANPSRYELAMAARPHTLGPFIAGASRRVRLEALADDRQLDAIGSQVIGPIMTAFVFWVRSACRDEDIHHLEFLSRDGELPLEIARALPADHFDGLTMDYLHCGRRVWSLAAAPIVGLPAWIEIGTKDPSSFLVHSATKAPFSSLLARCGLQIGDLPSRHALGRRRIEKPLEPLEVEEWVRLLRSGELDGAIGAAAQQPRDLILRFLAQRDLPSDHPIGLVDIGWRGQQAWLMSALVAEAVGQAPVHFHFGGTDVVSDLDDKVDIRRFALDDSVRPHPIASPVSCLEMFTASGRARLTGYSDARGTVVEEFESTPSAVDTPELRAIWRGAKRVAGLMPAAAELGAWDVGPEALIEETRHVLRLFWEDPDPREVEHLTALRFEGDDAGHLVGKVVRPYRLQEVLGRDSMPRQWQHGSMASTPPLFRLMMRQYFALKRGARRS